MSGRAIAIAAGLCVGLVGGAAVAAATATAGRSPVRHVLVLSIDGLHETDLGYYVASHPHSALAALVSDGVDYTHAQTTFPSDSFPGSRSTPGSSCPTRR